MKENVIISAAHLDDLVGCAGFALLAKDIFEFHVFDFTRGEAGLSGVSHEEAARIRTAEEMEACALLDAKVYFLGEIDGDAYANREVCTRTADLLRELQPRAIIAHWPLDVHLDHVMSSATTMKAIALAGIKTELYFYEETRQSKSFQPKYYVDISTVIEKKNELIRKYTTQNKNDSIVKDKMNDAVFRGSQVIVPYAEAYAEFYPQLQGGKCIFNELPITYGPTAKK